MSRTVAKQQCFLNWSDVKHKIQNRILLYKCRPLQESCTGFYDVCRQLPSRSVLLSTYSINKNKGNIRMAGIVPFPKCCFEFCVSPEKSKREKIVKFEKKIVMFGDRGT